MPKKSKIDRLRTTSKNQRDEIAELHDQIEDPPITGGRVAMGAGKAVLGMGGSVLSGVLHGRTVAGPVEVQHIANVVGIGSQIAKVLSNPGGVLDLLTELPVEIMRGNVACSVKSMRGG